MLGEKNYYSYYLVKKKTVWNSHEMYFSLARFARSVYVFSRVRGVLEYESGIYVPQMV